MLVSVRYHLQALRHLYVMATSPRLLLARNIHTNRACSAPVRITTEVHSAHRSAVIDGCHSALVELYHFELLPFFMLSLPSSPLLHSFSICPFTFSPLLSLVSFHPPLPPYLYSHPTSTLIPLLTLPPLSPSLPCILFRLAEVRNQWLRLSSH